jgi:hypothetical protein
MNNHQKTGALAVGGTLLFWMAVSGGILLVGADPVCVPPQAENVAPAAAVALPLTFAQAVKATE